MSLRNYLDKLRPQFEKGGKLRAFKSIYDGMDTFLYVPNERLFMIPSIQKE